jgi:hypothetical protein
MLDGTARSKPARRLHWVVAWHALCIAKSAMLTRSRAPVRLALNSKLAPYLTVALLASMQLTGCSVVKGIFKAGVWVGVLGVFAVIALIVYGISKLGSRA